MKGVTTMANDKKNEAINLADAKLQVEELLAKEERKPQGLLLKQKQLSVANLHRSRRKPMLKERLIGTRLSK